MAKITITPLEIIASELEGKGFNEFFNNNHLTMFNDEFRYIKKTMFYDKDVQEIVNKKFFIDTSLVNKNHDFLFKRTFILEFMNKQIKCDSLEIFASSVTSTFLKNYDFITSIYENADKFINNTAITKSKDDGTSTGKGRNAYQDLPQDRVNIDLNVDKFDYATNNAISKDWNEYERNHEDTRVNYDIDKLMSNLNMFDEVFRLFRKNCFLKIYS